MKTEWQMRGIIENRASRAFGVSRREARDSFQQDERTEAARILKAMIRDQELVEFTRATSSTGRHQVRLFADKANGVKWAAGQAQVAERAKRIKRLPAPVRPSPVCLVADGRPVDYGNVVPIVAKTPKPRFHVEIGPDHVSALDPQQCRPWATMIA